MLKELVELAKAKKQVNIAFTYLTAERYLLGIAPQGAGTDKIAPFIAKGAIAEIETQLAGLNAYFVAALAKKPEPVKEADSDEEGDTAGAEKVKDKNLGERQPAPDIGKLTEAPEIKEHKCRGCNTVRSEGDVWPEVYLCPSCKEQSDNTPPGAIEPAPAVPAVPAVPAAAPVKQATFEF